MHFERVGFSLLYEVNPSRTTVVGGRVADLPCQVRSIPIEASPTPRKSDLRRAIATLSHASVASRLLGSRTPITSFTMNSSNGGEYARRQPDARPRLP